MIVMDNASFHKANHMQQSLQAAGHHLLYLPPYSPDLNPIEHIHPLDRTEVLMHLILPKDKWNSVKR
jgi:transposase